MKNKAAVALGKLGAAKSPRSDAWRNMTPEERAEHARNGARARWDRLTEDQRKAHMALVRANRNPKA